MQAPRRTAAVTLLAGAITAGGDGGLQQQGIILDQPQALTGQIDQDPAAACRPGYSHRNSQAAMPIKTRARAARALEIRMLREFGVMFLCGSG